jgi:hypothetical protein
MKPNTVEKELEFAAWNVEDIVTHRSPGCKECQDGRSDLTVGRLYWEYLLQFYRHGCREFKTVNFYDTGHIREVNIMCTHCGQVTKVTVWRAFNVSHRLFKDYLKQMRTTYPHVLVVERKEVVA